MQTNVTHLNNSFKKENKLLILAKGSNLKEVWCCIALKSWELNPGHRKDLAQRHVSRWVNKQTLIDGQRLDHD